MRRDNRNAPAIFSHPQCISVRIEPGLVEPGTIREKYSLEELIVARDRLNAAKDLLDPIYIEAQRDQTYGRAWAQFQGVIDVYKGMRREIERVYHGQHVSNAYMKYWELYSQFNIVPREMADGRPYIAFFNAELPGAALCAFNHFMHAMRPEVKFDWRAASLVPSAITKNARDALGDRYGLWESNREKWLMDVVTTPKDGGTSVDKPENQTVRTSKDALSSNDGDATKRANLEDFARRVGPVSKFGGADLYSHDAGIDVSTGDDGGLGFNNQELANARIHLGCALAGFMTLRLGGNFIAKQYTFFETVTWNLIVIYATMFDAFYICKPVTSRPHNSEIYLVGLGFRGMPTQTADVLLARLQDWNELPLIEAGAISPALRASLARFTRIIFDKQAALIRNNVALFNTWKTRVHELQKATAGAAYARHTEWFRANPMKMLQDRDQLASSEQHH